MKKNLLTTTARAHYCSKFKPIGVAKGSHSCSLGLVLSVMNVLAFAVGAFFSKVIEDALRTTSPLILSRVSSWDANLILVLIETSYGPRTSQYQLLFNQNYIKGPFSHGFLGYLGLCWTARS